MSSLSRIALATAGVLLGVALWWRKNPTACPYGQRFWLAIPRPIITRERLRSVLEPRPAERLLEVGPGTGHYAVPVAGWLLPGGTLELLDVQQQMLDHTMALARSQGLENVVPRQGDARSLPYADASIHGAYLVSVLGEVPDQDAALRELRRVVRSGGRVVVGEIFGDPHMVTLRKLRERAAAAGLAYERASGNAFGYFARLGVP